MSNSSCSSEVSSISAFYSPRSEPCSESVSLSGSDSLGSESSVFADPYRLMIHILAEPGQSQTLLELYQPILDWIDPDLKILRVTETSKVSIAERDGHGRFRNKVEINNLGILLFLHEEEMDGKDRIDLAMENFTQPPWKFHHAEEINRGKIHQYPHNRQSYYFTADNMPLFGARQVHCGPEHLRFMRFVSYRNWRDTIEFYTLVLGQAPEVKRIDFALFTLTSQTYYDMQFALKRLPKDILPRKTDYAILQFRVMDVGKIVPLFPNMCTPLSDTRWQTTDLDGNKIILQVANDITPPPQLTSPLPSPMMSPLPSPLASPMASPMVTPMTSRANSSKMAAMTSHAESHVTPMASLTRAPWMSPMTSHIHEPMTSHTREPMTSHTREPMTSHTREHTKSYTREPMTSHTREHIKSHTREPMTSHTQEPMTSHTREHMTSHTREPMTAHTREPMTSHIHKPMTSHTQEPMMSPTKPPMAPHTMSHRTAHTISNMTPPKPPPSVGIDPSRRQQDHSVVSTKLGFFV